MDHGKMDVVVWDERAPGYGKPLKSGENRWKTKTPPAGEAGGVLEKKSMI
jgi:hypothetical protein